MKRTFVTAGLIFAASASAFGFGQAQRPAQPAPIPPIIHPEIKPFLMAVEDVFDIRGRGVVVTGRIEAGTVKVGDEIEILGFGRSLLTRVRGVEMFRKILTSAKAGDNVGITLSGVSRDQRRRGQILARPGSISTCIDFDATVTALPAPRPDHFQYRFRTADVGGLIAFERSGRPLGGRRMARITLTTPVAMESGQTFTMRNGGRTVGSGWLTHCRARGDGAAPPGRAEIETRVRRIVSEQLKVEPPRVMMDTRFRESLGADSLDFVELVMAFEEEFNIEIDDKAAEHMYSVGDVVRFIENRTAARAR